jgi:predicted AAA+ superfamily ATPase
MVRQVQPWSGNTKKRLVKTPKVYIRDTGLLHSLLSIASFDQLLGHPAVGASWEGFVMENILNDLPANWKASYYRSSNQAEIDLVLEFGSTEVWGIEIKKSSAPTISSGFHRACEDIGATKKYVVYSGADRFPMRGEIEAVGLIEFLGLISQVE